jgi:murein DD-endopeptidase MepM/ murein hydrolase activator NlpD
LLDDKKIFKQKILDISKWQQSFYEKFVNDKLKEEKTLQLKWFKEKLKFNSIRDNILKNHNCEYIDITKNNNEDKIIDKKCLEINRMIYSETQLSSSDNDKINFFDWPISAYKWISTFYHDEGYTKDFWSAHDAIDIVTDQWTPITAPADWYVVYIAPPVSWDYAYVALKHFNWYLTVYWHISEVSVKEYEFVEKWKVFAKSGWEYGTFWAWYLSTWPHLHLEVFKDKENIDPLTVLDLSYLNFNKLPEKYKFKFYNDFKQSRWYEYKDLNNNSQTFKLIWATEIERQQYLLKTYSVWEFTNWQIWIDESLDWNIDPSFVMCVWLAETTLWKHLKTPYNIWNVWNTDSWAVRSFPNARSWIYAMVRTFNNKYLSQYSEINKLSRYWNKNSNKPIYASSAYNWHSNIIKCLSHLKWNYVPDNYNFRIVK